SQAADRNLTARAVDLVRHGGLLALAVGAQQEDATTFVAGASSASILWFGLLAWGGSALAPILARPLAWRIIDGVIGVMMAAIALHLTFSGL
ncbi:MAG: LysE family transporter, partial [Marinobacter salsuginis]